MSVNKFISKICNLSEALKEKDTPSYIMLKKVFHYMNLKIKKSKTGAFRFKEDETQVLLLALEKAGDHRFLEVENDRLSFLERTIHEARN